MTVVTYGATVNRAVQAAASSRDEGVSVEIIDLRSLSPVDWETIDASVRKTSKVLVLYEDSLSWGYGAETRRADRRGALHRARRPGPAAGRHRHLRGLRPELEDFILPQVDDIQRSILELVNF